MSNFYYEDFKNNKRASFRRVCMNFLSLFVFTLIAYVIVRAAIT